LLLGAGGHALSCIDVIEREGRFDIVGLTGVPEEVGRSILGYEVIGTEADLAAFSSRAGSALVTVGQIKNPEPRKRLFAAAKAAGYRMATVISPSATVSAHARLGEGTIVMHGAVINTGASVGQNCIVNSCALLEHGTEIGDDTHVSTGAMVNGDARIGRECFIGSGALIRNGISVGDRCIIGMGERILRDRAPDSVVYFGAARE
jgi:sugar O-acyltransferase, sialic acid O-acetyltransferase NeuD family